MISNEVQAALVSFKDHLMSELGFNNGRNRTIPAEVKGKIELAVERSLNKTLLGVPAEATPATDAAGDQQ